MSTVVVDGGAGYYNSPDHLLLFGQVNLARCAALRAEEVACSDGDRFSREYDSCRLWVVHAQIHRWS